MFQLEIVNPSLRSSFVLEPIRFLPNPNYISNDLAGIDLGKFFSRVFHVKGIVKKAPRIIAGAATGALLGGGWGGAAAGAISAAAFKRKAGTSLFQDIYRGGLYGMIGGSAVGIGKVALGRSQEAGLIGKGYDYINKTFFGPKPTIQYSSPIGPEPMVKTSLPGEIEKGIKYPTVQGPCIVPGECPLPTQTKTSNLWSSIWNVTKEVIPNALPVVAKFGEKTLEYMAVKEQAKAAEYAAATTQIAQAEPIGLPGFDPFAIRPMETPGGLIYGSGPSGVPSDIGSGTAFPITPQEMPSESDKFVEAGKIAGIPTWMIVGGGGLVLLFVLTR